MTIYPSLLKGLMCVPAFCLASLTIAAKAADSSDDILEYLPAIIATSGATVNSCDLNSLNGLRANTTVIVTCDINLGGAAVDLPRGVKFEYDGGSIYNGTLVSANASFDSRVITRTLTISGSARLSEPVFRLVPSNWGIVETNSNAPAAPSETVAYRNYLNINRALNTALRLGATTFSVGKMDAYFSSKSKTAPIVELRSNLHFKMAGNTVMRIQPINANYSYQMLRAYNVDNVKVSGGRLIGSRLLHGPTEGAKSLFWITGSRNVTVKNVSFSLSATGLSVNSISWYDFPDQEARPYIPSEDIVITNNTFDSNQYNNLSVTDGRRVRIEGNKSYRAGNDLQNKYYVSRGRAPRIGIVIEPASNGPGFNQRIEDVVIKSNLVDETRTNSILAVGAFGVVIEGNTADGIIGWTTAAGVQIINNTITGGGIIGGFNSDFALGKSTDNIISGNVIRNSPTGIYLTNDDIEVFNNTIINCDTGMQMQNLLDSEIYMNTITSTKADSIGFIYQLYNNNVVLRNNAVTLTDGKAFNVLGINDEAGQEGYLTYVRDNDFDTTANAVIANSKGMEFSGNDFINAGIGFSNSSDMLVESNFINSKTGSALNINRAGTNSAQNIDVLNNTIKNTNGIRLGGYGVRINTVGSSAIDESSNIELSGNDISSLGQNYGLHSTNFDNVTITDNVISNEDENYVSLYFRGNDSTITNNTVSNGTDIQGSGNTSN